MDNLKRLTRDLNAVSERLGQEDRFSSEELGALEALKDSAPREPLSSKRVGGLRFLHAVYFAAAAALVGVGLAVWAGYSLLDEQPDVDSVESRVTKEFSKTGSPPGPHRTTRFLRHLRFRPISRNRFHRQVIPPPSFPRGRNRSATRCRFLFLMKNQPDGTPGQWR